MCSETGNSCAKVFDNRSRSKNLKPKKSRGEGQFDSPPLPFNASRVKLSDLSKLQISYLCRSSTTILPAVFHSCFSKVRNVLDADSKNLWRQNHRQFSFSLENQLQKYKFKQRQESLYYFKGNHTKWQTHL